MKQQQVPTTIPLPSIQEFIAGAFGGVAQTISSHPLDTIKARMQILDFRSPLHCLKATINSEGFFGLYKGIEAPLVGVAFVNAVVFTSYGWAKQSLLNRGEKRSASLSDIMLAGSFAGFVNSFVCSPIEMIKIRLQVQIAKGSYTGPSRVIKEAFVDSGVVGLFRGLNVTILKEVPACAGWYGGFELAKQQLRKDDGSLSLGRLMVAGSAGGMSYWCSCYPIDVIKARIQQKTTGSSSIRDNAMAIYKQHGFKGFYRGFSVALMRSIPSSATFTVYELVLNALT